MRDDYETELSRKKLILLNYTRMNNFALLPSMQYGILSCFILSGFISSFRR